MPMPAPKNHNPMPPPTQPSQEYLNSDPWGGGPMSAEAQLVARIKFTDKPAFSGPDELLFMVAEYFNWNEANPLRKAVTYMYKGSIIRDWEPKLRPMNVTRMCAFLGISPRTWRQMKSDRPEMGEVIEYVEAMIYDQKFDAAASDLMNAGFIKAALGISDKTQHTVTDVPAPENDVDQSLIADRVHPDDPDPTGIDGGVWPRPLYSQRQIDAGIPFTEPTDLPDVIEGVAL